MAKSNKIESQFLIQDASSVRDAALAALKGAYNEDAKSLIEKTLKQTDSFTFEAVLCEMRHEYCQPLNFNLYVCCYMVELGRGVFNAIVFTESRSVNNG